MKQKNFPLAGTLGNRGGWPGKLVLSRFIKASSCYINMFCKIPILKILENFMENIGEGWHVLAISLQLY